jgi:hypothetical protein
LQSVSRTIAKIRAADDLHGICGDARLVGIVEKYFLGCYFDLVRPASILKPAISGQNRPAPAPGKAYR